MTHLEPSGSDFGWDSDFWKHQSLNPSTMSYIYIFLIDTVRKLGYQFDKLHSNNIYITLIYVRYYISLLSATVV